MIERFTYWLSLALRRERWLILSCIVLGVVAFCAYTALAKPRYLAEITLLLPLEDTSGLGGLAIATGQGPSPLEVIKEVVLSDGTKRELAKETGQSMREVDRKLNATSDVPANSVTIEGEGNTEKDALAFVQKAYDILDRTSSSLALSRSEKQAENFKKTLDQIEGELPGKENSAAEYLKSMKAPVDPSSSLPGAEYVSDAKRLAAQLRQVDQQIALSRKTTTESANQALELPTGIPGIEPLRDQLLELQYKLHVAETTEGPDHPDVVRLKQEIAVAEIDIKSEISKFVASVQGGANKDIADLVAQRTLLNWEKTQAEVMSGIALKQGLTLKQMTTEADVTRTVIANLRSQYEIARVSAETDRVRWSILDKPHLKDFGVPINKHWTRTIVSGVLVGFLVGLLLGAYRRRNEVPAATLLAAAVM